MKRKIFVAGLIIGVLTGLFGFDSYAGYLRNVPQIVTQPDGSRIHCFATGDEFHNWLHDENNYTIMQNHNNGYFVYAVIKDGKLIPSEYVAGIDDPVALGLERGVNLSSEEILEKKNKKLTSRMLKTSLKSLSSGTLNNIAIFIRFSDQSEYSDSYSYYDNSFNLPVGVSMKSYFTEVSSNQLSISSTLYPQSGGVHPVSYQDAFSRDYYMPYDATTNPIGYANDTESRQREHTLLKNAVNHVITQIEGSGLDFDLDNDNYIDNICFIIQGATAGWSDLLWPHMWALYSFDVRINGLRVWDYNFQLSDSYGVSVLCHEMFHSLGAPDLYHYDENSTISPVGPWDLMASNRTPPQHMSAFMKKEYGGWFASAPEILVDGDYSLLPLSSAPNACYKIASPNSVSEYFMLEYRKAEGTFETSLPGSGLIIYRINTSAGQGNANGPPDEVYVYRLNGTTTNNGFVNSAYFSSTSGRIRFDNTSNPRCFLSDDSDGGITISDISSAGSTISFHVSLSSTSAFPPPENLTAAPGNTEIILNWEQPAANPLPDNYIVYRSSTQNGTYTPITTIAALTYTDENLTNNTTYWYYLTAVYSAPVGESSPSNYVSQTPTTPPVELIVNSGIYYESINPGGDIDWYYFDTSINGEYIIETHGSTDTNLYLYEDDMSTEIATDDDGGSGLNAKITENLTAGYRYYIKLNGYSNLISGDYGIDVNGPSGQAFNPPRNLTYTLNDNDVLLEWDAPLVTGNTLSSYKIYRNTALIDQLFNTSTSSYNDNNLPDGTYDYYVSASYSSPSGESDPSNHVNVNILTSAPDYIIENEDVNEIIIIAGYTIELECDVTNIGNAAGGASSLGYYFSTDNTYDAGDTWHASDVVPGINPAVSIRRNEIIRIDAGTAPGTYYIIFVADENDDVTEENENNNTASVQIQVTFPLPDLTLSNLLIDPLSLSAGNYIEISVNINNTVPVNTAGGYIVYYLSGNEIYDVDDERLGTASFTGFTGVMSQAISGDFIIPEGTSPGSYYLLILADFDNQVVESNETNNLDWKIIEIEDLSGINYHLLKNINIYPNPGNGMFFIEPGSISEEKYVIEVFSISGHKKYQQEFYPGKMSTPIVIDISREKPGMYFIVISSRDRKFIRKVVVK